MIDRQGSVASAILRPRSSIDSLSSCITLRYLRGGTVHVTRPPRSIDSLSSRIALRYPRGCTVYVARPARSILNPRSSILAAGIRLPPPDEAAEHSRVASLEIVSPLLASQPLINHPFVLASWLLAALSGAEQIIGNILLLAFVGGITYAGVVRMRRSEARRTRQIQAALSGLGFTLHEEMEELHVRFLGSFRIGQHGDLREIANRFESALYADGITTLMDYSFWKGSGRHRHVIRQTIAVISNKRYELPAFVLAPENFFARIAQSFGAQDIDFHGFPRFSGMFKLQGDDEAAVRALFTPAVIEELELHPNITLEGRGGNLLIFRFKKRVKPENFPRFLEEALQLALLFLP